MQGLFVGPSVILVFVAGTDGFKHLSNISSFVVGVDRPIDKSIILYTLVLGVEAAKQWNHDGYNDSRRSFTRTLINKGKPLKMGSRLTTLTKEVCTPIKTCRTVEGSQMYRSIEAYRSCP